MGLTGVLTMNLAIGSMVSIAREVAVVLSG